MRSASASAARSAGVNMLPVLVNVVHRVEQFLGGAQLLRQSSMRGQQYIQSLICETRTASISFRRGSTVPVSKTALICASAVAMISGRSAIVRNIFGMLPRWAVEAVEGGAGLGRDLVGSERANARHGKFPL